MNIFFYIEPLVQRDNPHLKLPWVGFMGRIVKAVRQLDPTTQFFCLSNENLSKEAGLLLGSSNVAHVQQTELVPAFGNTALAVATHWYKGGDEMSRNRMAAVVRRLSGVFAPDICLTFSPAPFLTAAFGDIPILHFELGAFSRSPFPETAYQDPIGMYLTSFPAVNKNYVLSFKPTSEEVARGETAN